MQFHRQRKVRSLLNIAPLLDCVFLLLIFFLLTSSFIDQGGLEIELPESVYTAPLKEKRIMIFLSDKGIVEINRRPSSLGSLKRDLVKLIERVETRKAIIRADKRVDLELLIKVMDLTKNAGINAVDIQALPVSSVNVKQDSE